MAAGLGARRMVERKLWLEIIVRELVGFEPTAYNVITWIGAKQIFFFLETIWVPHFDNTRTLEQKSKISPILSLFKPFQTQFGWSGKIFETFRDKKYFLYKNNQYGWVHFGHDKLCILQSVDFFVFPPTLTRLRLFWN